MIVYKTLEEIEKIREANQIIARLYEEVLPPHIKPGISTMELNNIIEEYVRSQGAIPATIGVGGPENPYPAASCISVNNEVVHGIPREDKTLTEGDIVSIDVVTNLNGYFGDAAITFPVGKVSEEAAKLIEVTKNARDIGIEHMVAGKRLGDVGNAVQKYVEKHGFTVVKDFSAIGTDEMVMMFFLFIGDEFVSAMAITYSKLLNEIHPVKKVQGAIDCCHSYSRILSMDGHVDFLGAGRLSARPHGPALQLGDARRHADHDTRLQAKNALRRHHPQEVPEHELAHVDVGNHPVLQRADRLDATGGPSKHTLRLEPDPEHPPVRLVQRHHRRLVQDDPLAPHVDQRVGRA